MLSAAMYKYSVPTVASVQYLTVIIVSTENI